MRDPTRAEKGTSSRWGKESFVSDEARNRGLPCTSCHLVSTVLLSKIAARPNKSGIATHVKYFRQSPRGRVDRELRVCATTQHRPPRSLLAHHHLSTNRKPKKLPRPLACGFVSDGGWPCSFIRTGAFDHLPSHHRTDLSQTPVWLSVAYGGHPWCIL